jgi:hypothetical protein
MLKPIPPGQPYRRSRAKPRSRPGSLHGATSAWASIFLACIRATGSTLELHNPPSSKSYPSYHSPTSESPTPPTLAAVSLSCLVPIALRTDEKGTLPRPQLEEEAQSTPIVAPRPAGFRPSGNDRATRLAAVALAWNVFQHFYPYFDVVTTDWPGELRLALARSAEDVDERAFTRTLGRLVAALQDGHGNVRGPGQANQISLPPFAWDWVEGQLVITTVAAQGGNGLKLGDVVVEIDGRPAAELMAEHEATVSGATSQWRRYRVLQMAAAGPPNFEIVLNVRRASALADTPPRPKTRSTTTDFTTQTVRVRRIPGDTVFATRREPRPAKIATIKPGVMYVDLDRITQKEFDEAVLELAAARGIVFDLRGYPRVGTQTIGHLIDHPVTCVQ